MKIVKKNILIERGDAYLGEDRVEIRVPGDWTSYKCSWGVKLEKRTPSSNLLIRKRNTLYNGSDDELEAIYDGSETCFKISIQKEDTGDFLEPKYYFDLIAIDPLNSAKTKTLAKGEFKVEFDTQTEFDNTQLPSDAERYIAILASAFDEDTLVYKTGTSFAPTEFTATEIASAISQAHVHENIEVLEATSASFTTELLEQLQATLSSTEIAELLTNYYTADEVDDYLAGKINTNEIGISVASLFDGKVPITQLPTNLLDDYVEYDNYAALPVTGETDLLYITINDNKLFRWTGSVYVEVSPSHTHSNKAILDDIDVAFTSILKTGYDGAVTASHGHSNKTVLDNIDVSFTTSLKTNYDAAYTALHTHTNKADLDTINQALATTSGVAFGSLAIGGATIGSNALAVGGTAIVLQQPTTGTAIVYSRYKNTSGDLFVGNEGSVGGGILSGSTAYAGIINQYGAYPLHFGTSGVIRTTISSAGYFGVGTSNPESPIAIYRAVSNTAGNVSLGFAFETAAGANLWGFRLDATDYNFILDRKVAGVWQTPSLTITRATGNASFAGTVTVSSLIIPNSAANEIEFTGTGGNTNIFSANDTYILAGAGKTLNLGAGGSNSKVVISASGNVSLSGNLSLSLISPTVNLSRTATNEYIGFNFRTNSTTDWQLYTDNTATPSFNIYSSGSGNIPLSIDYTTGNTSLRGRTTMFGNSLTLDVQALTSTQFVYSKFSNSSAAGILGVEGSVAGSVFTGSSAYATLLGASSSGTALQFATAGTVRVSINSAGATTFLNSVLLPNGSTSSPSINFTNSSTTGFYRYADQEIGIAVNGVGRIKLYSAGIHVDGSLSFGSNLDSRDVILTREGANILGLRNSTSAQTFRIYRTYTASNDAEWLSITGTDIQTVRGSVGNASNNLRFGTASAGIVWEIGGTSGHFTPLTNNVNDVGSSSKKIRSGYFGTSIINDGFLEVGSYIKQTAIAATSAVNNSTFIDSADNKLKFKDNSGTVKEIAFV